MIGPAAIAAVLLAATPAVPAPQGEGAQASDAPPSWIWDHGEPGDDQTVRLRLSFRLAAAPQRARLRMTCDNSFTAWLGGERVLSGKRWQRLFSAEVAGALRAGDNLLGVVATNDGGPAGLIARLDIELADGGQVVLSSDGTWQVAPDAGASEGAPSFTDGEWRPVRVIAAADADDLPWPDPFGERHATPAAELTLLPGFRAELVRSAQADEGSWIALAEAPDGRLLLSVEDEGLLELPADGRGAATPRRLHLPPEVRHVNGLLFAHGALYANVCASRDAGLYRLRDSDGDGDPDACDRLLSYPEASGEHGAHGVVLGPDDRLWLVDGNHAALPTELGTAEGSPLRSWPEDVLLPRAEDPRGHAVGRRMPAGHVLRLDPASGEVQLFAGGMRNAYDLAFSPDGELWTFDSDMEWDVGLPWYRPVRVCRVVAGADFGWRSGSAKLPPWCPDTLPGTVDVGRGSPTGVVFGTDARFPPAYRRALFCADWALGRILAVHVADGGGGDWEEFVAGPGLSVTDVVVGHDGALWFTTGGRGTQSGLYRVSHESAASFGEPLPAPRLPAAVALRRRLEALSGDADGAVAAAWPHLGSAVPEVRHAARCLLERAAPATWRAAATADADPAVRVAACLALARAGDDGDRAAAVEAMLDLDATAPVAVRRDAQRVAAVAVTRTAGELPPELRSRLARWTGAALGRDADLDRAAIEMLVWLGADGAVARGLDRVEAEADVGAAIGLLFPLRLAPAAQWDEAAVQRLIAWLERTREAKGGESFRGYLQGMVDELLQRGAPGGEALARYGSEGADEERPTPKPVPAAAQGEVRAWTVAELAGSLDRVGRKRSFASGRAAFTDAQCAACHRMGQEGGSLGPDLTWVGRRFSRLDMLRAIVEPSEVVSDQYALTVIERGDGSMVVGRVLREVDGQLAVAVGTFGEQTVRVPVADVRSRRTSPVSMMPVGLIGVLTRDQVLDLLAYLENGGDERAAAFR